MFNIEKVNNEIFIVNFKNKSECVIKKIFPQESPCSKFTVKLDTDADMQDGQMVDQTNIYAYYCGENITERINNVCDDTLGEIYSQIKEDYFMP